MNLDEPNEGVILQMPGIYVLSHTNDIKLSQQQIIDQYDKEYHERNMHGNTVMNDDANSLTIKELTKPLEVNFRQKEISSTYDEQISANRKREYFHNIKHEVKSTNQNQEYKNVVANESQVDRMSTMYDVCWGTVIMENPISTTDDFLYIQVDDKRKFLMCIPHKSGSTNWLRMLAITSGNKEINRNTYVFGSDYVNMTGIRRLSSYSLEEQAQRIHTYTKYIFVRNPYARLLSAYRDKFVAETDYGYKVFSEIMLQKMRGENYKQTSRANVTMTFREFIGYILNMNEFDGHWSPYQLQCLPCKIKYNYVGKFETFEKDASEILRQITGNATIPDIIQRDAGPFSKVKTEDIVNEYFNTLPKDWLLRLHKIYSTDLEMFGYYKNPFD